MSSNLLRESVSRMHGYVPGEQPTDPQIVKLNTNENPYPPSPVVAQLLQNLVVGSLRFYPDPVCHSLRHSLAKLHGCSPNQILIGNGSDELLALCFRAFVERDALVGYFTPSYSLYPVLAAIENLTTYEVPLTRRFGWKDPDPSHASLFVVTNPNAPTSLLFSREDVASFCKRASGVVVIDEAYVDFAPDHCMDLALDLPNVLVTRTVSKSYSLAGIRVGYVVGPQPLIDALYKIKDSYNVNTLSQTVAQAAMEDRDYFSTMIERIVATRTRTAMALQQQGFEVADSATNFLWVRPSARPARELVERLRESKLLVRYFPGNATCEYIRITIGTDEQMERLLEAIQEITHR